MISLLRSWDIALFHLINGQGQNGFLDWFMPFMTDLNNFRYVLPVLAAWLLVKEKKAGIVFLIFLGLTLAITDPFSSRLLKEWSGRIRPCHVLAEVRLLTDCNTSYSFPSSHAVNVFAAAFFLSQPFKKLSPFFFGIAGIVGYSRIYIGIHYPFDVIGGAVIGMLISWPMRGLKDRVAERWLKPPRPHAAPPPLPLPPGEKGNMTKSEKNSPP